MITTHSPETHYAGPSLYSVLWSNSIFSAISGLMMIFAGHLLAPFLLSEPQLLGLPASNWLIGLGAGLLPFAALVGYVAHRKWLAPVPSIIAADIGWVIASAMLIVLVSRILTGPGLALVIAIALVVAAFAAFQFRGLRAELSV